MKESFTYMGRKAKLAANKDGDKVTLTIDRKKFTINLHTMGKPEDNYIKLWMCPDAYGMAESPEDMAKQIITYWHQLD